MDNENSIAFITCVNDEELYKECLLYIDNLSIPDQFSIEKIAVRNSESITTGYNEGMKRSQSKYKVYLHQDTFIINRRFIYNMLDIFKDEKIGMFGCVGAEELPESAIWWEAENRVGKVYENSGNIMRILNFDINKDQTRNIKVEGIDGLIMVTQYDIPWRSDIFTGWDFYDTSQCAEFIRKGYDVVVPKQDVPWYIHDCGTADMKNGYELYRNLYIKEYQEIKQ